MDFAGWSMPVQYTSILDEHRATRNAVSLFDVSHMGRLRFNSSNAPAWLDRLLTRGTAKLPQGGVHYSLLTNQQGQVLDDVLVYSFGGEDPFHLLVVNASNRDAVLNHLKENPPEQPCDWEDITESTAMIAVQGPEAIACANELVSADLQQLKYYRCSPAEILGRPGLVSRTGYTGEDGCELIVPADVAVQLWEALEARPQSPAPAGLGARDTLRLEAAMPLYGHELGPDITPYEAGLSFAVKLDHEFIGREALAEQASQPPARVRIGLRLKGKRIAREEALVLRDDQVVGAVTSGSFSPTLECPIAMALVDSSASEPGTELTVDIRGRREPAEVSPLPFYKR